MGDLLLFNTEHNVYADWRPIDNLSGDDVAVERDDDDDGAVALHDAPDTVRFGDQMPEMERIEYSYKPQLGDVPSLDVPSMLPNLPNVADLAWSAADLPSIAPSQMTSPGGALLALPEVAPTDGAAPPTADGGGLAPPPIAPGAGAPPPPPPVGGAGARRRRRRRRLRRRRRPSPRPARRRLRRRRLRRRRPRPGRRRRRRRRRHRPPPGRRRRRAAATRAAGSAARCSRRFRRGRR